MRITRIMAIVLVGSLLVLAGCGTPAPTTPEPVMPTPTPPTTTPPPVTPPPVTPPPITPPPVTPPPITPLPVTPPPVTPPPTPTAVQGPYDVWFPGREFSPSSLTVPVGTKVTWTSKDVGDQHTVTSDTGLFNGTLSFGQSFSYTFTERGTFTYNCQLHPPDMVGKIIVE